MGQKYTPPEDVCLRGAEYASENALELYESAEDLARVEHYGPACSLLVLAGEEASKAMVLLARYQGLEIVPQMKKWRQNMMSRHEPRHEFSQLGALLERMVDSFIEGQEAFLEHRDEDEERAREARMKTIEGHAKRLLDDSTDEAQELQREVDWWENAEKLKQNGLYLDYNEEGWTRPKDITEDSYQKSLRIVKKSVDSTAEIVRRFREMDQQEREELTEIQKEYIRKVAD